MSQGFHHGRDMRITTNSRDGGRDFFGHDDRGERGDRRGDNRGRGRGGGGGRGRGRGGSSNFDYRDRGGSGGGGGYDRGGSGGGSYDRSGGGSYDRGGSGGGGGSYDREGHSGGGRWQRGGGKSRRGKPRGGGGRRDDGGPSPLSRLHHDDDGDVNMGDDDGARDRNRFNPYGNRSGRDKYRDKRPPRNDRGPSNRGNRGSYGGGLFSKALDSAVPDRKNHHRSKNDDDRNKNKHRDRPREPTWYKVMIPYGKKHDKDWLISAIRNMCTVPFQPVDYHFVANASMFYVEDRAASEAIQKVSHKITAKTGHKILIQTKPSKPPQGHSSKFQFDEKTLQQLKETMSKRYDPSTKQLNLSNLYNDEDMKGVVSVNKPAHMKEVIKIIEENIPEIVLLNMSRNKLYNLQILGDLVGKAPDVKFLDISDNMLKSDQELDNIKGFKLEEIWLRSNPFCKDYRDTAELVSAVRKRFPKLLKLDGNEMPAPIAFAIEEITELPAIQRSFMVSDEIERVLSKFIEHYYIVFDSTNRQALLEAYHEQARFSLTASLISSSGTTPAHVRSLFTQYIRDSRNQLKVEDGNQRVKLMKQGKLSTVAFLNELPEMQHDTSSFQVDVSRAEPNILAFTVHGVFKDVENKNLDQPLIAFSRFFVTVPNPATGCLIVNDELCLRQPTSQQKRLAFSSAAPTPSPSPVTVPAGSPAAPAALGLTAEQEAMVQQFMVDSQMNTEWSLKCLQENNWDYPAAGAVFLQLKENGSIPMEAFVK